MPVRPGPRRSSARPRPRPMLAVRQELTGQRRRDTLRGTPRRPPRPGGLLAPTLLFGVLMSGCATTTAGQASPAVLATTSARSEVGPTASTGARSSAENPTTPPTTVGPVRSSVTSPATSPSVTQDDGPDTAPGDASGTSGAPSAAPSAGWSIVPPAGLQSWTSVPADDVSLVWRSGSCVVVVSAPPDVPDMTDERFSRAHVRYAITVFTAQVDPTITGTGEVGIQETDPLRVSDPTRLEPPTVHLQLSGYRYEFPAIGVTDQTYSFVTQGGGQGLVVSAACTEADFTARYDSEIAPLIADLGVDTGI